MQARVIIMRGIPGSGKTTYHKRWWPQARVCSADFFFERDGQPYKFDAARIQEAHQDCWATFMAFLEKGAPLIVVDNTNLTMAEISAYTLPAQAVHLLSSSPKYEVDILTMSCKPEIACKRGTHGVEEWKVGAMWQQLVSSPLPPWFKNSFLIQDQDGNYPPPPAHLLETAP